MSNHWLYWALASAVFASLTAIFAFFFLGERPSQQEWLGIGLVIAGVLTLAFKR